jgi:predicted RNA-binding protein with PIN domain
LIDGYNLLRSVQKYELYADLTDVQLCRYLAEFLRKVHERGTIVFDGMRSADKRELLGVSGDWKFVFSGDRSDADSCIERIIEENTAPKRLVVVSSDRRLRTAAVRRKPNLYRLTSSGRRYARLLKAVRSQHESRVINRRGLLIEKRICGWTILIWTNELSFENRK